MKKIITIITLALFFITCNEVKKENTPDKNTISKKNSVTNYKSIEVEIEGMTCEIGCARTIESKLSKTDGVIYSNVDFKSKKGQFTFDSNKIKKKEIVKKIDGIAGGDVYSVTKITELKQIFKTPKTIKKTNKATDVDKAVLKKK